MIVFGAPSRYYQGPGCFDRIGEIVSGIGTRAVVLADSFVLPMLEERLLKSFDAAGIASQVLPFSGDVTMAAIEDLLEAIKTGLLDDKVDLIVAVGGGKAIDIGKAVSLRIGCSVVTVPTAAANDAPTSKNFVIYDESHALVEVGHLAENPKAVIADTAIIASAPRALLVAGIGDAVTKAFEAAQCYGAQGSNMFGARPSLSALALAQAGYRVVRERAVDALAIAGTSEPNASFEELVEALFVMGGLGFESGGLSIAHAMTRGLSRVPEAAQAMHGQQVAYGLLVQLALEGRTAEFMADLGAFYDEVGLAKSLSMLGVSTVSDDVFAAIAGPTLAAPHAKNFISALTEADLINAMSRVEAGSATNHIETGEI